MPLARIYRTPQDWVAQLSIKITPHLYCQQVNTISINIWVTTQTITRLQMHVQALVPSSVGALLVCVNSNKTPTLRVVDFWLVDLIIMQQITVVLIMWTGCQIRPCWAIRWQLEVPQINHLPQGSSKLLLLRDNNCNKHHRLQQRKQLRLGMGTVLLWGKKTGLIMQRCRCNSKSSLRPIVLSESVRRVLREVLAGVVWITITRAMSQRIRLSVKKMLFLMVYWVNLAKSISWANSNRRARTVLD